MPLVKVPAQLEDCETYYYGGGGHGHNQVNCHFAYQWENRRHECEADLLDFRLLPMFGRADEAAQQAGGRAVFAWVDPLRPDYAIAFVNDKFFALQSLGLLEFSLIIWLCVGVALAWSSPDRIFGRAGRRR